MKYCPNRNFFIRLIMEVNCPFLQPLILEKEERIPGLVCYWFLFRTILPDREMVLASVNATTIINFLCSHIHCSSQFEATPIHFRSYKKMGNRQNLINKCNKVGSFDPGQ